jgi:hypothetical protein
LAYANDVRVKWSNVTPQEKDAVAHPEYADRASWRKPTGYAKSLTPGVLSI